MRRHVLLLALPVALSAAGTEILWDTWGVPHIFAKDSASLGRAYGWAQAESHGDLVLRLYGQARGRGAEYWGEKHLDTDRWVRINGIPQRARQWYKQQNTAFRGYLEAFAAGINDYAHENPGRIDAAVKVVLPVDAVDVLAHVQRVIHYSFVARPAPPGLWTPAGSNAWAIGPKRSAGGKAMLLANPHLPWSDYFLFYEAQLTAPGVDAYGAALVGFPVLGIAFNDRLGWTHTVNTYDGQDHYELTLAEGGYRWDGKVRPFEQEEQLVKVKQADGTLRDEKLVIKRSVHGPVLEEKGGKALAHRVAGIDQPGMLEQWWDMSRARDLREFEAVLKRPQIPMFTVMYADQDGHILHLFGGRTPLRPQGDWNWGRAVPGDSAATLWTATHPYQDLPRVLNPPSGWLQNANDPPWTTTFPVALDPGKFPPYMASRSMAFRPQRSARMLDEDRSITFEEMIAYKHSTRLELADRILDDLIPAARQSGGANAQRAAQVLEAWDRAADTGSRGAVLFWTFAQEWNRRSKGNLFAVPWSEKSPRTTPDGLADPKVAIEALEAAVSRLEGSKLALDVAWGDVVRFRRGGVDLPANGAPGELGVFRVIGFTPAADGRFQAVGGDSYVAAVEFGKPVRAMAVLSYGNASQPGSKHSTDQLALVARQQMRPVWRTRREIEAHLESRKQWP